MPSIWQSYKFDRDDLYRLKLSLRPIAKAYNLRNTILHGSLLLISDTQFWICQWKKKINLKEKINSN